DFDIIGPYFTSLKTLESKFIYSCVMETVKLFYLHGLKTLLLVCDGASVNLTTLKATHGHFGVYPITCGDDHEPFKVSPKMLNPFDPPNHIHWIICPSHQLKNMINALFSSQQNGTKDFTLKGVKFGWETIVSLYKRDCERVSKGLTRMVPKMKEAYVIRDAWTKLNVAPAKIMQQDQVLMELSNYIQENPNADDVCSVSITLKFLEACQNFFENDPNFDHASSTQKSFLAWQNTVLKHYYIHFFTLAFDLLRIDMYGFKGFCEDFFNKYPGYFISPLCLFGSSIESLFSQYKYYAGGKLDSANNAICRASNLIQKTVCSHHSGVGYRDNEMSTAVLPLKKKIYGQKNK
uniref:Uncharacterized protein n=1 Tax=Amphimedon queenslandica TaxID=400682 RepID=A0A1X7SVI9_AMPQE